MLLIQNLHTHTHTYICVCVQACAWERERERERGTFIVHIDFTHGPKKWISPLFTNSLTFLFCTIQLFYFFFVLHDMGPREITFESILMLYVSPHFQNWLRLFPSKNEKKKKKKKLQSSIVLVEDFNELLSKVEKMSVSPFYILNIKILFEWFSSLGF